MHCSVPVRSVGQSRCRYRRRAIEYEYRPLRGLSTNSGESPPLAICSSLLRFASRWCR